MEAISKPLSGTRARHFCEDDRSRKWCKCFEAIVVRSDRARRPDRNRLLLRPWFSVIVAFREIGRRFEYRPFWQKNAEITEHYTNYRNIDHISS